MKKYVERDIIDCSFFELECNFYYNHLQIYHKVCKTHNVSSLLCLLIDIGRFQGMLSYAKEDNCISSEEKNFLYRKSNFLALRIKSQILHTQNALTKSPANY